MDPQQGPPQQQDLLIGQTVGNYLVTQKLGEGGMGAVYLAEHPTIGKKVALKVLHAEFSQNPEVAERFFNEAKAVNAIGHPNIVDIVDYGVLQTGPRPEQLVYFIMEFLAGQTLARDPCRGAAAAGARAHDRAPGRRRARRVAQAGIVHRDLKPDNIILIDARPRARLRQAARLRHREADRRRRRGSHRTRTGLVLGTPAYMSPEQCEGRANVDHRTDIYALGICLYEMLVGRVPFIGEGYGEILVQHLTQRPIEPSRYRMMSPHVEVVVMKALEKRPEMRYPTMDEFIRAMRRSGRLRRGERRRAGFPAAPADAVVGTAAAGPADARRADAGADARDRRRLQLADPGLAVRTIADDASGGAGQTVAAQRSRAGFVIAGVLVVAAAAIGVLVVVGGGKKHPSRSPRTVGGHRSDTQVAGTSGSATDAEQDHAAARRSAGDRRHALTAATAAADHPPTVTPDAGVDPGDRRQDGQHRAHVEPDGAEISSTTLDTGKTAPTTLTVERGAKLSDDHAQAPRLRRRRDPNVALDGGDVTKAATLKKLAPTTPIQPPTDSTRTAARRTRQSSADTADDLEPP